MMADIRRVVIDYRNYRGERVWRTIVPRRIHFGSTEWHPEEQWLLDALDVEREVERTFAIKDIAAWRAFCPQDQKDL